MSLLGLISNENSSSPLIVNYQTLSPIPLKNELLLEEHSAKSTNFQSYCHIVCMMCGSGILTLSYSMSLGGSMATSAFMLISMYLAYYSGKAMNDLLYYKSTNRNKNKPDPNSTFSQENRLSNYLQISELAYGSFGKNFFKFCQFSSLILQASLYYILCAINFKKIIDCDFISFRTWIILSCFVSCLPFIAIKTLKEASWLSLFGCITSLLMIAVVIYSNTEYILTSTTGSFIASNVSYVNLANLPLSASTISFAFGGNVLYPHVEHSMAKKKSFNMVLFFSILSVGIVYLIVGWSGLIAYGNDSKSPIFDNIKPGMMLMVAIIMLNFHLLSTVPLCLTTLSLDIEITAFKNIKTEKVSDISRVVLRTAISLFSLILALVVPYFSIVCALCGSFANGCVVYLLPGLFSLKLTGYSNMNFSSKFSSISLVIVGACVVIIGSFQSLVALKNEIFKNL